MPSPFQASHRVRLTLDDRALAWWNSDVHGWVVEPGTYGILVGTSSAYTPLKASVTVD